MSGRFESRRDLAQPSHHRGQRSAVRLLVIADLSGAKRASNSRALADRRPIAIDIDELDQVMARLTPVLDVELPEIADPLSITFSELDDFHPDRLFARLPVFAALRDLRARLRDANTFASAAAELNALDAAPRAEASSPASVPAEDGAAVMARLLGGAGIKPPAVTEVEAQSAVSRLIRTVVQPDIVHASEADQRVYLAAVDERITRLMRALLHHPAFQRLESAWRGLGWLISSLPIGEDLSVHVLDARREDLLADLRASANEIARTALYRLLVEETVGTEGGIPWSLIAADLTIGPDGKDVALAAALAAVGAAAGAPVIAAGDARLLGCESLAATPDPRDWQPLSADEERRWQELRAFEDARWLGLVLPRVLVRRPYGAGSDPIESFSFEELPAAGLSTHEQLLWGSPALAVAILCAQALGEGDLAVAAGRTLEDLPAHVLIDADGETRLQPCAEVLLSDRAADAILARGLMPLISSARQPSVLLPRLQSIAAASTAS